MPNTAPVTDGVESTAVTPRRPYTCIELFAGAGGLALGLEQAGFHAQALVEIDRHACATLRHNRPDWPVIQEDITRLTPGGLRQHLPRDVGEIDLLAGGYPCQTFSYAGRQAGLADTRGTLFHHYAQVLRELRPRAFIAENVRGLMTDDGGQTLALMLKVFAEVGYDVQWHLLRAVDYDVAQKRERLFIVGVREDIATTLVTGYRFPQPLGTTPTLREALRDVPASPGAQYPERKRRVLSLVPPGGNWRDLPEAVARAYMGKSYFSGGGRTGFARRLAWNEPCMTLTCSPGQKQTERCHPDEVRPLTVREYARVQSFPDDWDFPVSMSQAYRQIGNAVPVALARAVGLSVVDLLNRYEAQPRSGSDPGSQTDFVAE